VAAALLELPSTGDDEPHFISPAECALLFLAPLRPAPLSAAVQKLLEQNHRHWGGVSTNVARARLAIEREIALTEPLPPRPGVTFLFWDVLDDWKPPRRDEWGEKGFRFRSAGVARNGWPDSVVSFPPISIVVPADEGPSIRGLSGEIDWARLVERDLREAAQPQRPRRADLRSYRAALFPPTWPRSEIDAARCCDAYDAEFQRFPTRRR
jgi:hypothetical protein